MAKTTAEVTDLPKGFKEAKLPDGAVVLFKRPTNKVRRLLIEQPDTLAQYLEETIAAACIVKITLPDGYEGEDENTTLEFDDKSTGTAFGRLDALTIMDSTVYTRTFLDLNYPTRAMIEALVSEIKKAKK